jgi:D-aminopeptidase
VQSNFGGVLTINGAPVGQELGRYYLKDALNPPTAPPSTPDGSIIMVVATDAPLDARNLRRLASRAMMGLGRTGGSASNGSGDYVIAFSTAPEVRIHLSNERDTSPTRDLKSVTNDAMSPLFLAVIEATEEAIYNSLFRATTVSGRGRTVEALPMDRTLEILRKHGLITVSR